MDSVCIALAPSQDRFDCQTARIALQPKLRRPASACDLATPFGSIAQSQPRAL